MKVFGARVSPDGTVLDAPFEILETPEYAGSIVEMAVVANGSQWLVVGEGDSGGGLLGVRVAADGNLIDTAPVTLADGTHVLYSRVTLHVAQGEYLLVASGDTGFRARRFGSDLQPLAAQIVLPNDEPRVASNGTDYFLTWDPAGGTLYGSRMTLDGTLLDPNGIPLMESFWDDGNDSRAEWDGTRWWVFHELPYPDGGLHFVRVETSGAVVDSPPIFVFDTSPASFFGPYAVAGAMAGGLQLVWADQDCGCPDEWGSGINPWDIRGTFISAAAQILPDTAISRSAQAQTFPDLTAGPDGFLALHVSEVDEVQRIMARRLDPLGGPLDEQPIEIASGSYVTNPEAAWNGSVYMITWDEFYYCVGGDWPPCGNFIHAVRMLPDGTILDAEPIVVMPAWDGDVAALGDVFLVTGRHFPGAGHYVFPFGMRVDGNTGELLDPEPLLLGGNFAVRPRVTTFAGKWLVVWEQKASHDQSWGASRYNFVSADGAVKFEPVMGTQLSCGGARPEVAASASSALVVCREGAWDHFLNDVNGGLILSDETLGATFEISGAIEQQRSPTVAFDGLDFVVVWEDMRNAEDYFDKRTDLFGARISVTGTVLDPLGVPVATDAAPEWQPALASAGGNTLLATSIFRGEVGMTSYRLGLFHATATFTDSPDASFSGTPTGGCSPLAVGFTDHSLGDVTSWLWHFGDGSSSMQQNPSHLYASEDVYSVTLTVTNMLGGFDTAARFDYITSAAPTAASFTASPTQVCAPIGEVAFTDLSAGFPDSWTWDFGDGTHSTEQHPTHAYLQPGLYAVTLTVGGSCGSDSTTIVDLIQVDPPCDQVRQALSDIPVVGSLISGDYTSTHVYDDQDFELFYEVLANDGAGYYGILEHRWDFDVAAGDPVTFHANTFTFPDRVDGFRFEFSTDGTTFLPLVDIPVEYGSLTAPLPPDTSGLVYIRLVDTDRTPGNYSTDGVSVDFMSIDTFVPLPPLFTDSFETGDASSWSAVGP
jgi:PKD repeat protein